MCCLGATTDARQREGIESFPLCAASAGMAMLSVLQSFCALKQRLERQIPEYINQTLMKTDFFLLLLTLPFHLIRQRNTGEKEVFV